MKFAHDHLPVHVEVGPYSSVVGQSLVLSHPDGPVVGQIMVIGANLTQEQRGIFMRQIRNAINRSDALVSGLWPLSGNCEGKDDG